MEGVASISCHAAVGDVIQGVYCSTRGNLAGLWAGRGGGGIGHTLAYIQVLTCISLCSFVLLPNILVCVRIGLTHSPCNVYSRWVTLEATNRKGGGALTGNGF